MLLAAYPESLHALTNDGESIMVLAKVHSTSSHPNASLLIELRKILVKDGSPRALQQIADADAAKPKVKKGGSNTSSTKAAVKSAAAKGAKKNPASKKKARATVDDESKMPALPGAVPDSIPDLLTPDREGGNRKRRVEGVEESPSKRGRSVAAAEDTSTSFAPPSSFAAGLLLNLATPLGRRGSKGNQDLEEQKMAFV